MRPAAPRGARFVVAAVATGVSLQRQSVSFGFRTDFAAVVTLGAQLGAGSYGVVRAAELVAGAPTPEDWASCPLAVKSMPKLLPRCDERVLAGYHAKIRSEVATHARLSASLSVVTLFAAFEDATHVHLLMQRCGGGDLVASLPRRPTEADVAASLRCVLRSVAQCASSGVVFRDVKPEAFLAVDASRGSPLLLHDFGLASFLPDGRSLTERCGTAAFVAPEVLQQRYGRAADVWSAGVVAYRLLTGSLPFSGDSQKELFASILYERPDFEAPPWTTRLSPSARDFTRRLLEKDPSKRITAHDALGHAWLREGGLARGDAFIDGGDAEPHSETIVLPQQPLLPPPPHALFSPVAGLQRFGTASPLHRALLRRLAAAADADGAPPPSSSSSADDASPAPASDPPRPSLRPIVALFDSLSRDGAPVARGALISALTSEGHALSDAEWACLLPRGRGRGGRGDLSISRPELLARLADWHALAAASPRWGAWADAAFAALAGGAAAGGAFSQQTPPPTSAPLSTDFWAAPGVAARRLVEEACDAEGGWDMAPGEERSGGGGGARDACAQAVIDELAAAGAGAGEGGAGGGGGGAAAGGGGGGGVVTREAWGALLKAAADEGGLDLFDAR